MACFAQVPCSVPALQELWTLVFGDPPALPQAFFQHAFVPQGCYYHSEAGEPVSALYLLPVELRGARGAYLYAAATLPALRGRGYMRALVREALAGARAAGLQFVYLCPAEEALYAFYEPLGFTQTLYGLYTSATAHPWTDEPAKMRSLAQRSGIAPVFSPGVYRYAALAGCRVCEGLGCEFGDCCVFPSRAGTAGERGAIGMLAPLSGAFAATDFYPFLTMN